jgi:hypothetical protein
VECSTPILFNRLSHIHGILGFLARELLDEIPRTMADVAKEDDLGT